MNTNACLEILKKLRIAIRAASQHSSWIENHCGINGAQLSIMQELLDHGSLRVGELAQTLAIHRTTTSNLVDDLEKRGYVLKARDHSDQRVVIVTLSEQGTAMLLNTPKHAISLLPEALLRMDDVCLRQLECGLQALVDCIEVLDAEFSVPPQPVNRIV